jgi:hypothetical protein
MAYADFNTRVRKPFRDFADDFFHKPPNVICHHPLTTVPQAPTECLTHAIPGTEHLANYIVSTMSGNLDA